MLSCFSVSSSGRRPLSKAACATRQHTSSKTCLSVIFSASAYESYMAATRAGTFQRRIPRALSFSASFESPPWTFALHSTETQLPLRLPSCMHYVLGPGHVIPQHLASLGRHNGCKLLTARLGGRMYQESRQRCAGEKDDVKCNLMWESRRSHGIRAGATSPTSPSPLRRAT